MKTINEKIKARILIPIALAILILLGVSIVSTGWLQQRTITEEVKKSVNGTQNLFYESLKEDSQLLNGLIDLLKEDKELQDIWLTGDRFALLNYTKPIFENTFSKYRVTHFYFHNLNKVCFLRVHSPSRYGDLINRFTMDKAVDGKNPVSGIELGPLGTFTLRVVQPWWIDNKLVGYIELGEEIEHITPKIMKALNVDLYVTINKSYLNRANWEEGMNMLGRDGNWDLLEDFVIINNNSNKIPEKTVQKIASYYTTHKDTLFKEQIEGRNYRAGFIPLVDAGDYEVGSIIVLKDVSQRQRSFIIFSAILAFICLAVGIILFIFFYFYINMIEQKLITAYLKLKKEIKDHKKTEEKLLSLHDELEVKINERTCQLTSTVQELTVANRELMDFAHITAHDLKTPLRGIGTLSEWITIDYADKLDEEGRKKIELLKIRSQRLYNQVESILKYSEIGWRKYKTETINLNKLVNQMVTKIDLPKNIHISVSDKLPTVLGERARIIQIFQNLLNNAIRHIEKPDGKITVGCIEEKDFWKFSITDNGTGIEEKYFDKIFKIFQTLPQKDDPKNTGIGLAIVKRAVEHYGGKIWVESTPGQGTSFLFTIQKHQTIDPEQLYLPFINN